MTEKLMEINESEQVVEFLIGDEAYALPISHVEEIIQPLPVTPIPRSHPAIMGLTLVRGKVLPVIDLATALKKERDEQDGRFIVVTFQDEDIVLNVHAVNGIQSTGVMEEPQDLYREQSYVLGVIPREGKILPVLDLDRLLTDLRKT